MIPITLLILARGFWTSLELHSIPTVLFSALRNHALSRPGTPALPHQVNPGPQQVRLTGTGSESPRAMGRDGEMPDGTAPAKTQPFHRSLT